MARPLSLSLPLLPEGMSHRGDVVEHYFDNLLPEEGQRQLIARAAHTSVADAFGLLTQFGAESAGSITLLPPDQQPTPGELRALPDEVLSQRIRDMPRVPLAEQAAKRMSLAGAQHKAEGSRQQTGNYTHGSTPCRNYRDLGPYHLHANGA